MTASIRVSTDDDAEGIVALRREQYPFGVTTVAALRHYWRTERPEEKALRLVAEAGGEIVAVGRVGLNTWTTIPGAANLGLIVRRPMRGQGIGGRLYDTLMDHLVGNGGTRIEGWGDGDDIVGGFLARRGFERRNELRYSHLDLRQPLPPMPAVPDGVRAVSYTHLTLPTIYSV